MSALTETGERRSKRMSDTVDKADAWDVASKAWGNGFKAGRREALEEAAKILDKAAEKNDRIAADDDPHRLLATGASFMAHQYAEQARNIAAAIRALMEGKDE